MGSLRGMHILGRWLWLLLLGAVGSEFRSHQSDFYDRFLSIFPCFPVLVDASIQLFGYAPGKCEISIAGVIQDMLNTEARIIFGTPRPSQTKLLRYDLYTPLNPEERQLLRPGDLNLLRNSHFNPKWPVR